MAIDGVSPAALVFPIFNFVLRGVGTGYEIASVPSETSDILKTTKQVLADVRTVKDLRKLVYHQLEPDEIKRVDDVIKSTEGALAGLEVLIELARVDMDTHYGRVGALSRLMWVMRDSTKVHAALARLMIASQSLHTEMNMLKTIRRLNVRNDGNNDNATGHVVPPPSYDQAIHYQATLDILHEKRQWNSRRRPTRVNAQTVLAAPTAPLGQTHTNVYTMAQDPPASVLASVNNIAGYIRHNEQMLASLYPPNQSPPPPTSLITATRSQDQSNLRFPDNISELDASEPSRSSSRNPVPVSAPQGGFAHSSSSLTANGASFPQSTPSALPSNLVDIDEIPALPSSLPSRDVNLVPRSQRSPRRYNLSSPDLSSAAAILNPLNPVSITDPPISVNPFRQGPLNTSAQRSTPSPAPRGEQNFSLPKKRDSRTTPSDGSVIESPAYIPGHGPMLVRWRASPQENGDNSRPHDSGNIFPNPDEQISSVAEQHTGASPPDNTHNTDSDEQAVYGLSPGGPVPTRRFGTRIRVPISVQPSLASLQEATPRSATRIIRHRSSRLEWQVTQHRNELRNLNAS